MDCSGVPWRHLQHNVHLRLDGCMVGCMRIHIATILTYGIVDGGMNVVSVMWVCNGQKMFETSTVPAESRNLSAPLSTRPM